MLHLQGGHGAHVRLCRCYLHALTSPPPLPVLVQRAMSCFHNAAQTAPVLRTDVLYSLTVEWHIDKASSSIAP
jgi:hypothetical protein